MSKRKQDKPYSVQRQPTPLAATMTTAAVSLALPALLAAAPNTLLVLQGVGLGDLVWGGPCNMGDADGRALFFAWVGPTRFRRAALVVIQPGAAELGPQRLRRGLGPHAILPQRALEGVEGRGGA